MKQLLCSRLALLLFLNSSNVCMLWKVTLTQSQVVAAVHDFGPNILEAQAGTVLSSLLYKSSFRTARATEPYLEKNKNKINKKLT